MKRIENSLSKIPNEEYYSRLAGGKGIFLDIETTGLKRECCPVYLIGLLYPDAGGFSLTLLFAENEDEEGLILKELKDFLSGRDDPVITFNGNRFDLPFLLKRYEICGISAPYALSENRSIDIYALIKPLRRSFGLSSLNQKSVEKLLGIEREDKYSGGELIDVYKTYTVSRDPGLYKLLVTHNKEDVLGMAELLPVLSYAGILRYAKAGKTFSIQDILVEIHSTYDGKEAAELRIDLLLPESVPKPRLFHVGELFLRVRENTGSLRVPMYRGELKHYFPNYKDYLYIPSEDKAVLKTIGKLYSEKTEKATAKNCYIRAEGMFIPLPAGFTPPEESIFRNDLKEGPDYVMYGEGLKEGGFYPAYLSAMIKSFGS